MFLIGHDILNRHSSVEIGFDGNRFSTNNLFFLAVAQVPPFNLFSNLNPDWQTQLVVKAKSERRPEAVEDPAFYGTVSE
ncbi:hypothetical protein TNCV_3922961 [Trichonephila clavipes]|nr:hypothetical protein TNCV_3922961 [Trichonephila clavipes]